MEDAQTLPTETSSWHVIKKFLFRFSGLYLFLYIFPFPLGVFSPLQELGNAYDQLWLQLVNWMATNFLGITEGISNNMTGSGDRTYDFALFFTKISLAFLISIIWSILDRKKPHYQKTYYWLIVWVRYYLAVVIIGYGFAKVIKTQFPFPSLIRLLEPYGESSPMGLAWTFMGYSKAFNIFTGLGEVIGGFLLFFRRTTTIGAFILIAVLSSVVMMNFSYDIPVKLFSTHLLLMAIFLLGPDFKRLYQFFVSNQTVAPANYASPFARDSWRIGKNVLKFIFIAYVLGSQVITSLEMEKKYGEKKALPPLYGIYDVTTFVHNGDTLPPLLTDEKRWRRLVVTKYEGRAQVQFMSDVTSWYTFKPDTTTNTLTLFPTDISVTDNFTYQLEAPNRLHLQGVFQVDTLEISLTKKDLKDFLLVGRDFNWIQERPFNR